MKVPARLLTTQRKEKRKFPPPYLVKRRSRFSTGKGLAVWYVAEFCRLNGLKYA